MSQGSFSSFLFGLGRAKCRDIMIPGHETEREGAYFLLIVVLPSGSFTVHIRIVGSMVLSSKNWPCKRDALTYVGSHLLFQASPFKVTVKGRPKKCHCKRNVTVTGVTVSGEVCRMLILFRLKLTLYPGWPSSMELTSMAGCTVFASVAHPIPPILQLCITSSGKERTRARFIGITALRLAQFLGRKSLESSLWRWKSIKKLYGWDCCGRKQTTYSLVYISESRSAWKAPPLLLRRRARFPSMSVPLYAGNSKQWLINLHHWVHLPSASIYWYKVQQESNIWRNDQAVLGYRLHTIL